MHVVEKRILFCRLLVVFLSKIKNISHGITFTGIVLDMDRKWLVIRGQNNEKMQWKTRSLYRSFRKTRMMNASALKWNIPLVCETKSNKRLTWSITVIISVSLRLRNLYNISKNATTFWNFHRLENYGLYLQLWLKQTVCSVSKCLQPL